MKSKLEGVVVQTMSCPEHGQYRASVLHVAGKAFPSRCPTCREDDARQDLDHWREEAFFVLRNLGRATMGRRRKRREGDREFFVRLLDDKSGARVAVGNFWAASESEAVTMAENEYPGLFHGLETHTWRVQAELVPQKATA